VSLAGDEDHVGLLGERHRPRDRRSAVGHALEAAALLGSGRDHRTRDLVDDRVRRL
jgi:hypothetical protein